MNKKTSIQFDRRLIIFLFYVRCLVTLLLAGCGLIPRGTVISPDQRTGPNLVIFFAEDSATRRMARTIAQITGGDLFDISGKKPLPGMIPCILNTTRNF